MSEHAIGMESPVRFVRDEDMIEAAIEAVNAFDKAAAVVLGDEQLRMGINHLRKALKMCGRIPNNPEEPVPDYARYWEGDD